MASMARPLDSAVSYVDTVVENIAFGVGRFIRKVTDTYLLSALLREPAVEVPTRSDEAWPKRSYEGPECISHGTASALFQSRCDYGNHGSNTFGARNSSVPYQELVWSTYHSRVFRCVIPLRGVILDKSKDN